LFPPSPESFLNLSKAAVPANNAAIPIPYELTSNKSPLKTTEYIAKLLMLKQKVQQEF